MPYRTLLVFLLLASPAFPVAKEIVQIQRDIALLQDQVRTLQRSFDERLAVTQQLLNQNLEGLNRVNTSLAVLEKAVHSQGNVLVAPVANLSTKMDTMASQFQALQDAVNEMNSRLAKLQQQVIDIKNTVTTLPPPTGAPSGPAPSQPPAAQTPPDTLYKNALRDYQAANFNLAGAQFSEYIKLYGNTELAGDAQFYLGEIFYQQEQYDQAAAAFDKVLERYPEGKRTPDAQYKKGMCFLKQGRRDAAAREYREVKRKWPRSPAASLADEELKKLGLSRAAPPKSTKARRR